jgi:broad specificity phosphatase PhoE
VVTARLTLVSSASTAATNDAAFPADEPLDHRGLARATAARGRLTRIAQVQSSPALSCRQTCSALGLEVYTESLLREWDLGRWRGRTLDEVAAVEPDAVHTWLTVPTAAPHGGETLVDLLARVATWLAGVSGDGHLVAVTHAGVVRAAIISLLAAPPDAFWRLDIPPLTVTEFRARSQTWNLRSAGRSLTSLQAPTSAGGN